MNIAIGITLIFHAWHMLKHGLAGWDSATTTIRTAMVLFISWESFAGGWILSQ
jgi:hypothetical protein